LTVSRQPVGALYLANRVSVRDLVVARRGFVPAPGFGDVGAVLLGSAGESLDGSIIGAGENYELTGDLTIAGAEKLMLGDKIKIELDLQFVAP
jgi:hypothetical protein